MARKERAATFENVRVDGDVNIDLGKMSGSERRTFHSCTFSAVERFYADPENVRRFAEWQAKRRAAAQAVPQI